MSASQLCAVLASFLGKDTPFAPRPAPFIALGFVGFAIALIGHIFQARTLVTMGIVMILCATILLPLVIYLSAR